MALGAHWQPHVCQSDSCGYICSFPPLLCECGSGRIMHFNVRAIYNQCILIIVIFAVVREYLEKGTAC